MGVEGTKVDNARLSLWIDEGMGKESSFSGSSKVFRTIGDDSDAICH